VPPANVPAPDKAPRPTCGRGSATRCHKAAVPAAVASSPAGLDLEGRYPVRALRVDLHLPAPGHELHLDLAPAPLARPHPPSVCRGRRAEDDRLSSAGRRHGPARSRPGPGPCVRLTRWCGRRRRWCPGRVPRFGRSVRGTRRRRRRLAVCRLGGGFCGGCRHGPRGCLRCVPRRRDVRARGARRHRARGGRRRRSAGRERLERPDHQPGQARSQSDDEAPGGRRHEHPRASHRNPP
jgi:hypothetical protein